MKRIYKDNDLIFNLAVNDFPYDNNVIKAIEFKFYTINTANCIEKTKADINENGELILEWRELSMLEQGVLYFDYKVSVSDEQMGDGTYDTVVKQMTNYFIVTGKESIDVHLTTAKWGDIAGDINNQADLVNYIDIKIKDVGSLTNYYSKDEIDAKGFLTEHQNIDHKLDVTAATETYQPIGNYLTEHQDLSHLATKEELGTKADSTDIADMLTKTEAAQTYQVQGDYVTNAEMEGKGYLTQHQSIDHLATKEEVNKKANSTDIADMETQTHAAQTYQPIGNYATKEELPTKVSELANDSNYLTEHQPLDNYYTKKDVYTKIEIDNKHYLTQHQSLENYYTINQIDAKGYLTSIPAQYVTEQELELKGYLTTIPSYYVTETELANKHYLTQHQSLAEYPTKIEMNQAIDEKITGTVDLTNYYKKTETYSKDEIDKKGYLTEHQSLTNYVTNSELEGKGYLTTIPSNYVTNEVLNSKGYLTEHQDISGKLDKSVYAEDKKTFALKSDIPSTVDMATKTWVGQQGYLTSIPAQYVTEQELNNKGYISAIPSYYVTESELNQKGYLTEHQKLKTINGQTISGTGDITIEGGSTTAGVTSVNGKKGDVTISASDLNVYTINQIDNKGYLTEHQQLKTINNQSIVGSGNITIEGGGTSEVTSVNGMKGDVTITPTQLNVYTKTETYSQAEINDKLKNVTTDGVKRVNLTQQEYDQLSVVDDNTLYYITDATAAEYATAADLELKADKTYVDQLIGGVNDKINSIKTMI